MILAERGLAHYRNVADTTQGFSHRVFDLGTKISRGFTCSAGLRLHFLILVSLFYFGHDGYLLSFQSVQLPTKLTE